MKLRKERGGTLALIAAATITLILLGICFFFLAKIFGGEREMQHATDSGNLNVAKNALRKPSVRLTDPKEIEIYGQLGDRSLNNNALPPNAAPINLLTYNRLLAQALLICLNAKADPGPGNIALTNAADAVNILQTGANSIGGRLSSALAATSNNPLLGNFSDTADQNSLRMLGNNSSLSRVDTDFKVAYLEQTPNDVGATNIEVPAALKNLFPSELQTAYFTTPQGSSKQFLRGYIEPAVASGTTTPVGVPLQPGEQPHLVSNKTFENQEARGATFANALVPPNGFRSKSTSQEENSAKNAVSIACAEVGSLNQIFTFSAPYGYIKIQNGPDGGPGTAGVDGPFAGLDHVLNNELLNPGIFVAGQTFSTDLSLEQSWAQYNHDIEKNVQPPPPKPSLDGLYNLNGEKATLADAQKIPYDSSGKLIMTQCTDDNSTGWSRSDPDVVPQCWDLLGNGSGPGAFDNAYHNGQNTQYSEQQGKSNDLLSVECAKCQLQHKFNTCGDLSVSNANCSVTGLRTFARGVEVPSAKMGQCQVSQEGSVKTLGEFVQPGFGTSLENYVAERAKQIKPSSGDSEARALLAAHTLKLGEAAYIYMPAPDNGKTALVWTNTPPPWISNPNQQPDGTEVSQSTSYNIVGGLVNPHHDGGIHDIMYRDHPGSGINGTDTASWTPSSGYKNLLGKVMFTDAAAGTASGFCKPD